MVFEDSHHDELESDQSGEESLSEVQSKETRSRLPKSVRDLRDFNNAGLKEDNHRQGRVDAAFSPGTRSRVRRVSQRLQDLEQKQASREETLHNKRRGKDPNILYMTTTDKEEDWRSWLAR